MKYAFLLLFTFTAIANDDLPFCERDKTEGYIDCPDGVYQRKNPYNKVTPKDMKGCYPDQTPGYILCPDGIFEILRLNPSPDRNTEEGKPGLVPFFAPEKFVPGKRI